MIPRVPDDLRAQIVHLRGQRMPDADIGRMTGVHPNTVRAVCRDHYSGLLERAKDALRREINLARSERHTAPLFHPEEWR